MKKRFFNSKELKEYYNLNSLYELMNGDLVSCNSYGIKYIKRKTMTNKNYLLWNNLEKKLWM